jgi:hypothetical protein
VSDAAWELVFMMVILKLPIAYLIGVVWWAVRAAPDPYEPAALVPSPEVDQGGPCPWRAPRRPLSPQRRSRRSVAALRR